jgi:hypothetical protein
LAPPPTSFPLSPVSNFDRRHTGRLRERERERQLADGREGEGVISYDGEEAWSSVNNSIIAGSLASGSAIRDSADLLLSKSDRAYFEETFWRE